MKHIIERVIRVQYEPKPELRQRIRFEEDKQIILPSGKTLWQDKLDKPSIFDSAFNVSLYTNKGRILRFTIHERFIWNNADIVGPIQLLAFLSKDDRRILLASGIHDFMLDNRKALYEQFSIEYPSLTKDEFVHITSEAFRQTSVQQGLSKLHAWWVSGWMCLFQKTIRRKKWEF